ncbi:MAG TPA: GDSL-type esterase/lipase family protein [Candidatus Limnocylindria bacterium]|jgi:lysophospholipase L1-like esterase
MGSLRFVPLGDSYTIGTSVADAERWPNQLVARLAGDPVSLHLVGNPAVNGFASGDLIRVELPKLENLRAEFVTVQIGVNDVVQGVPDVDYSANVSLLLDSLLEVLAPDRLLCLATPDYTVTPQGAAFGQPETQRAGIMRNNEIMRGATEGRGIRFVPDVFEISQAAGADRRMLADDGLHPSGAQYGLWVDAIEPIVRELLASVP